MYFYLPPFSCKPRVQNILAMSLPSSKSRFYQINNPLFWHTLYKLLLAAVAKEKNVVSHFPLTAAVLKMQSFSLPQDSLSHQDFQLSKMTGSIWVGKSILKYNALNGLKRFALYFLCTLFQLHFINGKVFVDVLLN